MCKVTLLVLAAAAAVQLCSAYPGGAPASVCESLTPGHGVDAQPDAAPYHIMTSSDANKTEFEITLMANTGTNFFKGFMLQARDPATDLPVGVFSVNSDEAQTVDCFDGEDNTVTHVNDTEKMMVTLIWTAPETRLKEVAITYTVAKESDMFWVKQQYMMEVNKGGLSAFNISLSLCFSVVFLAMKLK